MFALPFIRRRWAAAASIPPGTYATPQDVSAAIAQLIGGAPPTTLDQIAEIAAHILQNEGSIAAISAALAGKQAADPKLTAFAGLALAADKLIYATGGNTLATSNITAFARSILAAVDAAGARAAIGAQPYSQYLTDLTATLAGVPAGSPAQLPAYDPADSSAFSLNVGEFGIGVLGKGYAGQAGYVYYNSGVFGGVPAIPTNATSRAIMARAPAAAGEIVYATDLVGGVGGITTNAFTRGLMAMAAPAANRVLASDGANITSITTGAGGRNLLALTAPAQFGVPIFTDNLGNVDMLVTTSLGRSMAAFPNTGVPGIVPITTGANTWTQLPVGVGGQAILGGLLNTAGAMPWLSAPGVGATLTSTTIGRAFITAATAQAAKALIDIKARFFSRATNLAIVANTPTELTFDTQAAVTGYDVADVALASGRVQASNAGAVLYRPHLTLTVDGPIDLDFTWSKQSTGGVASTEGMLLPTKTRRTFAQADTRVIEVPGPFLMLAGGNEAQLKIVVTSPAGAATQNILSAKLMLLEG